MRYPAFLKENGTIGFIAPSFGAADEWYGPRFDEALKKFQGMGYKTPEGPNCRLAEGIGKSNTPEKCAAEINDFFTREDVDAILSVGGGETMCEDLSFVDFEAIGKADPKWFMGYSDNTNLTLTLPTLCDTAAVYGECATAYGLRKWHPCLEDGLRILTGKTDEKDTFTFRNYPFWEGITEAGGEEETDPLKPWNLPAPSCLRAFAPGSREETKEEIRFEGRLLGGCMDVLQLLCGTRFDKVKAFEERYKEDGIVWFLEACDLNPMSIRRVLWQLREAGWFETAKGFIFGRPLHFAEEMMGMDRTNAVLGAIGDLNVPILLDTDLGHLPPAIPYISGAYGKVSAKNGEMKLSQILK